MKTKVIYFSKTSQTKKIADAMANALGITAQSVIEKPNIGEVNLLFIGSGIYAGKVAPEIEAFVAGLNRDMVKKVVLFSTSMAGVPQMAKLREILQGKGIEVASDEFSCKGKFLFFCRKHPDSKDQQSASQFAKSFIE